MDNQFDDELTMDDQTDVQVVQADPQSRQFDGVGPGALLKAAREAKNISQADIAKKMRLSLQRVKDIESDDYRHSSAMIYVRGYLHSYARLVDLPSDRITEGMEALNLEKVFEEIRSGQQRTVLKNPVPFVSQSKRLKLPSRKMIRWISIAAVALLVILVAVWWQGKKHTTASPLILQQQPLAKTTQTVSAVGGAQQVAAAPAPKPKIKHRPRRRRRSWDDSDW